MSSYGPNMTAVQAAGGNCVQSIIPVAKVTALANRLGVPDYLPSPTAQTLGEGWRSSPRRGQFGGLPDLGRAEVDGLRPDFAILALCAD
jgi:hypothetical protein